MREERGVSIGDTPVNGVLNNLVEFTFIYPLNCKTDLIPSFYNRVRTKKFIN